MQLNSSFQYQKKTTTSISKWLSSRPFQRSSLQNAPRLERAQTAVYWAAPFICEPLYLSDCSLACASAVPMDSAVSVCSRTRPLTVNETTRTSKMIVALISFFSSFFPFLLLLPNKIRIHNLFINGISNWGSLLQTKNFFFN